MGEAANYVASGDGFVHYECTGTGPRTVLFLGFAFLPIDSFAEEPRMRRVVERLEGIGRVVRFDRRGIGRSDPLLDDRPIQDQWIEDAVAVLDAIDADRVIVLGTFITATTALALAARRPERVSHLVVVNGFARALAAPDFPIGGTVEKLTDRLARVTDPTAGDTTLGFEYLAASAGRDPAFRAWWNAAGERGASPQVARRLYIDAMGTDLRDELQAIEAPTLVVHRSANDALLPAAHGAYLAEHISDATLVTLDAIDLMWFADRAELVLDEVELFVTGGRAQPGDRALAVIAFLDIVGSTRLAEELGDRRWREVLDSFEEVTTRTVDRHGGRVVKHTGDGVLATFPLVLEAISALRDLQTGGVALGLDCRIGLHVGEIVVRGNDIAGLAVHAAARCCDAAEAGEILVTTAVREAAIGTDLCFDDRGAHELRGLPGSWRLWNATTS